MRVGEVITTTYIRQMTPKISVDWKAPKNQQFVFLCMGVENKDGTNPLNIKKVLNDMGWFQENE